uniref:Peptidoglycan-binding protein n=1 Tax=Streptomyces sp. NBC_00049 TaxID=2903617 RepID=A0AAU2JH52_9ACTN
MSHDSPESGIVPDDRLLVRPYVAPSGLPSGPEVSPWPQSGPYAVPGPAPAREAVPAPAATPRAGAPGERGTDRRGADPLTLAVLVLLALAAAGGLVFLLSDPEPEPPRAEPPTGLSMPALPERSPGAGEEPAPETSVRPATTAPPTESPSPDPTATRSAQPTPSASAPSGRSADSGVTLRMGDRGPEVRALQEMLFGQGFTYVSVTGVYDGQTKRGVSQLQRDRSVKGDPNGVYGPAARAAME